MGRVTPLVITTQTSPSNTFSFTSFIIFHVHLEIILSELHPHLTHVHSMASIHEMLYQSESFSHLTINEYLQKLVTNIVVTFHVVKNIDVIFDLQEIRLNINQAIPFSLIINEVITNAFKHAFDPDQTGAKLSVTLTEEKGVMHIQIIDNGKGLPQDVSKMKKSLGMQLIDTLSFQLDATYRYYSTNGETHFTLEFEKKEVKGSGNVAL